MRSPVFETNATGALQRMLANTDTLTDESGRITEKGELICGDEDTQVVSLMPRD